MKLTLLILASFLFTFHFGGSAQCTINTIPTQPGIYPDTLPDGMVGQSYSEDITFVMPTDTSGFDFTNFYIQSITGLPFGLTWTCNASANNCNYNPQANQYGCLNVSGVPLQAGVYPLSVSLIATLQVIGDIPTSFDTQITILADTSSNSGFSITGGYGCTPLLTTFTNNNPGYAAYFWNFGNGVTSTQENPSPQYYTTPGSYVVTYEAFNNSTPDYYLTEVQVLGIPNNWGWPSDLDPDIYIKIYDGGSNLVYTSLTIDDTNPPVTFAIPNILLANQTYTVAVWDEDGGLFGADDDLGSTTFQGWGPSGSSTTGSTSIAYTIQAVGPFPVISSSDTIQVFEYPNAPNIDSSGLYLWTDSVNLSLQWYQNGNAVPGANGPAFQATVAGEYFVISTSPSGCYSSSDTITIVICDPLFTPAIYQNGHLLYTDTSSYSFQWFLDGTAIPGATGQLYTANTEGNYWVELTAYNGCVYTSAVQVVDFTSLANLELNNASLRIYPNPSEGSFLLEISNVDEQQLEMTILDISGRLVESRVLTSQESLVQEKVQLNVSPGIFFVTISNGTAEIQQRIVVK